MTIFLLSLGIFLIALFLRDGRTDKPERLGLKLRIAQTTILAVLVALAALCNGLLRTKSDAFGGSLPVLIGLFVGVLASYLAYVFGASPWQRNAGRTAPLAMAALAVSVVSSLPVEAWLALLFGAAATAWLVSIGKDDVWSEWPIRTSIFAAGIVLVNILGGYHSSNTLDLGSQMAIGAIIAGILAIGIAEQIANRNSRFAYTAQILVFVFLSVVAYLILRRNSSNPALSPIFSLSSLIALLAVWVMSTSISTAVARTVLAGILWVSIATASYGYAGALGMSIALLAAATTMIFLGNNKALLSAGPLAALVVYRVFRQLHADTAEAFDIGQHYALIGFLLGVLLPVLAQEWSRTVESRKPWIAGGLWTLLMAAAPLPIAVALSDKGIVGYLVGLGMGPILEAVRGENSAQSLSLATGLAAAMAVLYTWFEPHLEVDRHGKIIALSWILGAMAVAVIAIVVLSRTKSQREQAVNA